MVLTVAAAAQQAKAPATSPPATEVPPSWAVNCSNRAGGNFVCEMTQALIDGNSRAVILLISISTPKEPGSLAILLRAAHGVYLPAGIHLQIDAGKPTVLEFQKSDQNGVYAALPLTPSLIAELKRGQQIQLAMEINKGQKATLNAPLKGFNAAYDRVTSK